MVVNSFPVIPSALSIPFEVRYVVLLVVTVELLDLVNILLDGILIIHDVSM